jgi:TP901 family phage tail tape measure protein
MNSVLQLAAVGEMTVEEAGKTLIGVMKAFDIEAPAIGRIGDVFTKAAAESQTSVQQMTEAMKTASVVHSQYGASLEDTATALTLLAKVNITGTAAGTSYRNMLKDLYTPGKQAADLMKTLGLSTQEANGQLKDFPDIIQELRKALEHYDQASQTRIRGVLFSERGGKEALQLLSQTREEWDKLNRTVSQSQGFMAGINEELLATTSGTFKQALNTLQVDLVKAFNMTEGPMHDLAVRLKDTFSSKEFQDGVVSAVKLMGTFASVVLSAVSAVSSLVAAMPNGTGTFVAMAASAGAVVIALSSLTAKLSIVVSGFSNWAVAGAALLTLETLFFCTKLKIVGPAPDKVTAKAPAESAAFFT